MKHRKIPMPRKTVPTTTVERLGFIYFASPCTLFQISDNSDDRHIVTLTLNLPNGMNHETQQPSAKSPLPVNPCLAGVMVFLIIGLKKQDTVLREKGLKDRFSGLEGSISKCTSLVRLILKYLIHKIWTSPELIVWTYNRFGKLQWSGMRCWSAGQMTMI